MADEIKKKQDVSKKDERQTILLVEDEVALLETYADILDTEGYDVLKADNGYKGLEVLEANKDIVDLMIVDLMMPGIDGLEVIRKMKAAKDKYGEPPVIVLTNMTSERVIKEAFKIGASSYLIKSELEAEDLDKEIQKFIGDREIGATFDRAKMKAKYGIT